MRHFNSVVDYFLYRDISWNFSDYIDNFFDDYFFWNNFLFHSLELDYFIYNFFYNFINFNVDVLLDHNLLNTILNNRNLNDFFYFLNSFFDHHLWNNSFNNLRNLNDFLDHSRNDYDLLHDLFDFNYFGYLHHLLDYFLYGNLDFFDTVNMSQNFNNFFFDIFDGLRHFDVVINDFLNLNSFGFSNDDGISNFNDDWNLSFNDLNNRFFNDFLNCYDSFVDEWHLNYFFNFFWYFFDDLNYFSYFLHNFFDSVHRYNLFHNNFYCIWSINSIGDLDYLFNNLRDFNDSLFSLDDNDRFFNDSIHRDVSDFNMIFNFFCSDNFDFLNNFLNYLFNLNNFWNSDDFLDNFLDDHRNFHNFFNNFFHWDEFLLVDDNLFDLGFNVVHNFSHSYRFLDLNLFFHDFLDYLDFWDLANHLDNSVLNCRNFNSFFDGSFKRYYFVYSCCNNDGNFNGERHSFLDFNNFFNFYYLFDNLLNWNDLRHFNNAFNDLLNNFFDFNDLGDDSEHLQDVINVDNSHDFLINHSDNSLVDFQSHSCSDS